MCKAHFRKGGESRRQVRNSESCFAPRRAGKRERPPEALRRSDERRGRALAPPRHKNVPSHSNFPLSPPSARLLREPRRRFAGQSGLSRPRRRPRRLSRSPQYPPTTINAAIRTPARRSALGFAERGRRRLSPPPPNAVLPFGQNRVPRPLPPAPS